jgi:hypothetical protein
LDGEALGNAHRETSAEGERLGYEYSRPSDGAAIVSRRKWEPVLEEFKQSEEPESVLLVSGSQTLIRILVAWKKMEIRRNPRSSKYFVDSDGSAWQWLWKNVEYSMQDLEERLPFSDSGLQQKVDALIANRVLYPDGTINSFADRFLREKVVKLYPSARMKK